MSILKKNDSFKNIIDSNDAQAFIKLSHFIQHHLHHYGYEHWVIVCIGTDRSTGDALGPLVGTKLKLSEQDWFTIYGTLEEPVHAINLQETIQHIKKYYSASGIIAIDASLGQLGSIGTIQVVDGPLKPGAGVHKELPEIGHFHISGIVNIGGFMEYFVLQNTRLSVVMKMADTISNALNITPGYRLYKKENAN